MQQNFDIWEEALSTKTDYGREYLICKEVLHRLQEKQLFLDSNLSLTKFCVVVGTNTTYLSNAVNKCLGCNLKCLINWYRIQYAKSLLRNDAKNLNGLPAACGFASKSAFYASFKKVEGITPLQYTYQTKIKEEGGDR